MQLITNHVPRLIIEGYELTETERKDFDYLDWDAIEAGEGSASFFRYKGQLYDLGEFLAWTNTPHAELREWDGYQADTFYSALVVRYVDSFDRVVVARVWS